MRKILALWAVPRSTSTAFEWMMRQRGDMECFHEPFGEAWYQGEEPLWPRVTPDSKRTPGLTLGSVVATLKAAVARGPVFSKDFPHYIEHMWDDDLLALFNHSFLIRDPAKTITSMFDKWPDFTNGRSASSSNAPCSTGSGIATERRRRCSTAMISSKTHRGWWRPGAARSASRFCPTR